MAAPPSDSSLVTRHSSLETATPFLAFTYLGVSAEEDLTRDHQAEALRAQKAHERELKRLRNRSSKDILVDGVIDGSYLKYLNGEK